MASRLVETRIQEQHLIDVGKSENVMAEAMDEELLADPREHRKKQDDRTLWVQPEPGQGALCIVGEA